MNKTTTIKGSLGEFLEGCESTKVTLKETIIDITLDNFEFEGNVKIVIGIINDVDGLNTLDDNDVF